MTLAWTIRATAPAATFLDYDSDGRPGPLRRQLRLLHHQGEPQVRRRAPGLLRARRLPAAARPPLPQRRQRQIHRPVGGGGSGPGPSEPVSESWAVDLDLDGRVDVYVANDGTPNQLWINQGGRDVPGPGPGVRDRLQHRRRRRGGHGRSRPPISTATGTRTCS